MDDSVLSKKQVRSTIFRNKFICPPMGSNFADLGGGMNFEIVNHYKKLISSGVGMVIMEAVNISEEGMITSRQIASYSKNFFDMLYEICLEAKKKETAFLVQICHGGKFGGKGESPLSPIDINTIDEQEVKRIVKCFVDAAVKVKEAGADGVELHMAHGYLIAEFISLAMNKRKDDYGGSLKNRMKVPLKILREVREAVGNDFIVQVRISAVEGIKNGMSIDESTKVAKILEENGADIIHVSCGVKGSKESSPSADDSGEKFLKCANEIKKVVKIPVIAVGKIHSMEVADYIIENKIADFVAIGRPLLCDYNFVNKIINNEEVTECLYCNEGCLNRAVKGFKIKCVLNKED